MNECLSSEVEVSDLESLQTQRRKRAHMSRGVSDAPAACVLGQANEVRPPHLPHRQQHCQRQHQQNPFPAHIDQTRALGRACLVHNLCVRVGSQQLKSNHKNKQQASNFANQTRVVLLHPKAERIQSQSQ